MKKHILSVAIILCCAAASHAQTIGTYKSYLKETAAAREHPVDMKHTIIDVKFDCAKGEVIGKVTHQFRPLQKLVDSIFLDAPGIEIKEFKMLQKATSSSHHDVINDYILNYKDGKKENFKTNDKGVTLYFSPAIGWDSTYTIEISYKAKPARGLYFIGWNDETSDQHKNEWGYMRKQIWTQGQGTDNRYWIPCYDEPNDKTITETIITFDKKYQVLSNGVLQSKKDNKDNTIAWHYKMSHPHATYLVMLGIGEFAIKSGKSAKGTPVNFWYYPEFSARVPYTACYTEQMVDFMEEELMTAYPWESYSQVMVQDFLYGAMENTTATIFGDFFYVDGKSFNDRNYVNVNMHEFTHQWFGDYVTARNYAHQWLQESYATHYPKYFERKIYGEDYFQWKRKQEMLVALDASKSNNNPVAHTGGGTSRVYQKGSLVLDMLRYVLGNDEYRRMTAHYLKKHGYGNVETYDLQVAIHDVLGKNLDWFFDEWTSRGGEPHYNISWSAITNAAGTKVTNVTVKQLQEVNEVIGYFKMPIVIQVHYTDGTFDEQKPWVEGSQTNIAFVNAAGKQVAYVLFDVNNQILKQVTYNRTFEELKAQLETAPNMIDRYEALLAMKDIAIDKKKDLLFKTIAQENFHALRSEAWNQLFANKYLQTHDNYAKALGDPSIEVRKSIVANTATIPGGTFDLFYNVIADSSYTMQDSLLEKLYLYSPNDAQRWLVKSTDTGMGNGILIKRLELLYRSGDKSNVNALINMASSHFEFRTRINAFNALKAIDLCNEEVVGHLLNAAASWNGRLGGPAKETLDYFAQQKAYKVIILDIYRKLSEGERKVLKEKGVSY